MKMRLTIIITILCIAAIVILIFSYGYINRSPYKLSKQELIKLTKRAEHGDADAARCIAFHYEFLKDMDSSFHWLRKSSQYNNLESKYDLYFFLKNDPKSQEEAFDQLNQAAALNYPLAQREMASLYYEGKLFKKNLELAEIWATKAAENGDESAMELLPNILIEKRLKRSDLIEAFKWTIIALSRINPESETAREIRTQQTEILKKADAKIGITPEIIKREANKLAVIKSNEIPISPDPMKKATKFLYETCHPE